MALTAEEKAAIIAGMDSATLAQYNKETPKEQEARLALIKKKQDDAAGLRSLIDSLTGLKTDTQSQETATSKDVLKLTPDSAKLLLTQAAQAAQFTGKLSKADIDDFIVKFQAEAQKQMAMVIKQAQDSQTVGATPSDLVKSVSDQIKTNFPTFFKAETFAQDYIWSKVNFKDEASLSGNALTALSQARKAVSDMRLLGVSDAEVRANAKLIARGKKSIADYTAELQQVAIKEYPHFADRFKSDPTLTIKDIASPVINMLAKNWEMDPSQISLDDPYVMSFIAPTGADGKSPPPTYADLYYKSLKDPKRDYTVAANEEARQAATSLARAMGAGI